MFLKELEQREIIKDCTNNIKNLFSTKKNISGYLGIDPTGKSLHVGHLIPLLTMIKFQQYGHIPYFLIGGATGMIGDPSFKSSERVFLKKNVINNNKKSIKKQLKNFLNFNCTNKPVIVDNNNWFSNINVVTFLREAGKEITVSYMMAKDSVSKRINNNMSFTEFSYQILQAYDFYFLHKKYNVDLQIGGGDQWGNITTGVEFIRKKCGDDVHAFTLPLLVKKDGTKFGKTENGTIWLDPKLTSPYLFYQFWINLTDEDAKSFIKIFSFKKSLEEINDIIKTHNKNPENRIIQKHLAAEITTFVHGENECNKIIKTSDIIFKGNSYEDLHLIKNLNEILKNIKNITIKKNTFNKYSSIFEMFCENCIPNFFNSKKDLKRDINNNCIFINKKKYDFNEPISSLVLVNNCLLIQKGKKQHFAILIK